MKRHIPLVLGLLLVGACSSQGASPPEPAGTQASAATAKSSRAAAAGAQPQAAVQQCREETRDSANRVDEIRQCYRAACEAGDADSCAAVKTYDGYAGQDDEAGAVDAAAAEPAED